MKSFKVAVFGFAITAFICIAMIFISMQISVFSPLNSIFNKAITALFILMLFFGLVIICSLLKKLFEIEQED